MIVVATGKATHGLELGMFGRLVLCVVQSWFPNEQLLEYAEIGEETEAEKALRSTSF